MLLGIICKGVVSKYVNYIYRHHSYKMLYNANSRLFRVELKRIHVFTDLMVSIFRF